MRRSRPVLGVVAGLALLLSACGGGSDSASGTRTASPAATKAKATATAAPTPTESAAPTRAGADLVIWTDDTRAAVVQKIGDAFGKEKGVSVAVQQLDFGDIRDNLVTQGPSGKGPDVIVGAHDWLGKLVTNGAVAPLELGDRAGEFSDVAIEAMTYEGTLYGLPYAVENIALLRNTALAPQAPATWEELTTTGQELVKAGKAKLPVALQVGEVGDPYHFYPLATSFGASVFGTTPDGGYNPKDLQIDNAGGLAFAEALSSWRDQKVLSPDVTFDIAKETFANGQAPYTITGPWNVEPFTEAGVKFVVEPIPSAGGKPAVPFVGVQGFMVSANAKNRLVANDFVVNYLGTPEVARELYDTGKRPPALTSVAQQVASDPVVAGFAKVGADGQPLPSIPAMDAVWSDWGNAQRDILLGKGDPRQLMSQAAAKIRDKIGSS